MRRALLAAAALAAGLAPMSAAAQRITPTLSTTMQRICEGERRSITVQADAPAAAPEVMATTNHFRALRDAEGYLFYESTTNADGETIVLARVADTGEISNPELRGSAMDAARAEAPDVDWNEMAQYLAIEIPERLIVGRSFDVGDDYYPPHLQANLIEPMAAALGVPFPITSEINIPYRGESVEGGRRVWTWEGEITMRGSGVVHSTQIDVMGTSQVRVVRDAETALTLALSMSQTIELRLLGQPYFRQEASDGYTCQISPQ